MTLGAVLTHKNARGLPRTTLCVCGATLGHHGYLTLRCPDANSTFVRVCDACDCADPTAARYLADDCDCACHS